MTPSPPTSFPADLSEALAGQYGVEREIGRGGMGVVHLARDLKLERRVAIKTLPPHLATDPAIRERFLREARTAGSLFHPNIVPIHRADELAGQVFFVMGYVDGESLAARVRARGRIPAAEAVPLLRDVASALAYAHSRQVIHRDVKAENILVDSEAGRAVVTDFGIARVAESTPLTATGQMLGTVHYVSPEQISGEPVDGRTDIYSLGVVGYLALSGRFPFDAALASAVIVAHVNTPLPPLLSVAPDVDPALAEVIERCLAKDPNRRYASCRELVDALTQIATTSAPPVRSGGAQASNVALPNTATRPPLLSDTEAQAILHRAAELDELTAARERPRIAPPERDRARDLRRTSGHQLGSLREAAREVGIADVHLDRAIAEHGLLPKPAPQPGPAPQPAAPPSGRQQATGRPRAKGQAPRDGVSGVHEPRDHSDWTVGDAKVRLRYVVEVDGEMPARDFDLLVATIREEAGHLGRVSAFGQSLNWDADPGSERDLHASVVARDGKTVISVYESLESVAPKSLGGVRAGVAVLALLGAFELFRVLEFYSGPLIVVVCSVVCAGLYFSDHGNRVEFEELSFERQARVRALTAKLGEQARESIGAPVPPPPPEPTRPPRTYLLDAPADRPLGPKE